MQATEFEYHDDKPLEAYDTRSKYVVGLIICHKHDDKDPKYLYAGMATILVMIRGNIFTAYHNTLFVDDENRNGVQGNNVLGCVRKTQKGRVQDKSCA